MHGGEAADLSDLGVAGGVTGAQCKLIPESINAY